jgi:type I restriction enzyme S subunit
MKLETLFEYFEHFAGAPDAVAKMRELILRLAFNGGLSDAIASQSRSEWKEQTIDTIATELTPGFACGKSHQLDGGHVHLRTHNISTLGTLNFDLIIKIDPGKVDSKKASIKKGDILFNNTNSQDLVGKTSLVDQDYPYGFSNHLTRIRLKEVIHPAFFVYFFKLLRDSGYFASICTRWINQAGINTKLLKKQTIPLPPLAEQKRIVAKVDALMALCDRLEEQEQERATQQGALARASLARFASAPTPANLQFLFHKSYDINPADLRETILTLAVQGKLVLPKVEAEFSPLGEILSERSFNGISKGPTSDTAATEVLRISAGTSRDDFYVDEEDFKHVNLSEAELEKAKLKSGDLLACRYNGNLHYVGRFSFYRAECGRTQVNPDKLIRFRVNTSKHNPRYICFAMNATPTRVEIEKMCTTTAGNIGLSAGRIKSVSISLPPPIRTTPDRRQSGSTDGLGGRTGKRNHRLPRHRQEPPQGHRRRTHRRRCTYPKSACLADETPPPVDWPLQEPATTTAARLT